jgi:hypothetical protein
MIDLSNLSPFASGGNRDCYEHPTNPNICIKVTKSGILENIRRNKAWYKRLRSSKSFDDNLREESAYKAKRHIISIRFNYMGTFS